MVAVGGTGVLVGVDVNVAVGGRDVLVGVGGIGVFVNVGVDVAVGGIIVGVDVGMVGVLVAVGGTDVLVDVGAGVFVAGNVNSGNVSYPSGNSIAVSTNQPYEPSARRK